MITFFVKRPVAAFMVASAIMLFGVVGISRAKMSLLPPIVFPRLYIITPYGTTAPEEMENLVTRPIEDAVSAVQGVKKINALSQEGLSVVETTLDWGSSLDMAVINIRQRLDLIAPMLPQDTGKSTIIKFNPSDRALLTVVVHPVGLDFAHSRDYVETNIKPLLERVEGIASAAIFGGMKREIRISVDPAKMNAYNLNFDRIMEILDANNLNLPAGKIYHGDKELSLRIMGQYTKVKEIDEVIVNTSESGASIHMKDVAEVQDSFRERVGATLYNGEGALVVTLRKEPDSNAVNTAKAARAAIEKINTQYANNIKLEVIDDASLTISDSIRSVAIAAILGAVISFFVLHIFLKNVFAAAVVSLSIPFSIITTFFFMFLSNVTINIMSLGGLSLGVGMLVDASIVSLESILTVRRENPKLSLRESSIRGGGMVTNSVISSTLTSVAVFLPIIFVSGLAGELFRDLALTVTFSLLSSVISSLLFVPVITSIDFTSSEKMQKVLRYLDKLSGPLFRSGESFYQKVEGSYLRLLTAALHKPHRVWNVMVIAAAIGVMFFFFLRKELFPEVDSGYIKTVITLPPGTDVAGSESFITDLQKHLMSIRGIRSVVTNIGYEDGEISNLINGVKKANYSESLITLDVGKTSSASFLRSMESSLRNISSIKYTSVLQGDILQEVLGGSSNNIVVEINSADRKVARLMSERLADLFEKKGFHPFSSTIGERYPEYLIKIDPAQTSGAGLSPDKIIAHLRTAVAGRSASSYRELSREYDIRVQFPELNRNSVDSVLAYNVPLPEGGSIPLAQLVSVSPSRGYSSYLRENQSNVERIEFLPQYSENELDSVIQEFRSASDSGKEEEFQVYVKDDNAETRTSLMNLVFAFLLSILLIYQLIAAQFESFVHSMVLMVAVPLMFSGSFLALFITARSLNINSGMGLIMLVGIVVNATIVLFESLRESSNQIQSEKSKEDISGQMQSVVVKSCQSRLMPIFLSSLTTIVGMLPMALNFQNVQSSLAISVLGGIFASSVLSLIVYPVLFYKTEVFLIGRRKKS